ncbi:hypothetical protein BK025_17300 [Sodalis sp. TME1]|nr:hypothetical protein BK025_17300 [Sodalis sp. TME1]
MEIIIIGAGMIGASLAFEAVNLGARVTVLDAGERVSGTSGTSFAWVNAHGKPPRDYQQLNNAGIDAHQALQTRFPHRRWLHLTGSAEFRHPHDAAALAVQARQLTAWGYPARWRDKEALLVREPALARDAVPATPILWCEREGWLDTRLYINTLLDEVIAGGGSVATATAVAGIIRNNQRVTGVTLANGRALNADLVVNCCGRWADSQPFQPDLALPLAPTAGLLVRVPSAAAPVRHVLITPTFDVRPDGPGHSLICPNHLEVAWALTESPAARDQAAADLLREAARLLPGLRGITDYQVTTGIRALPKDGLPAVGPLPGLTGYYCMVTHSGVTLAALLATLAAREMVTGQTASALAPFRPDRLFS